MLATVFLLLLSSSVTLAMPQGPGARRRTRAPVLGRALDAEGKPWAGARVILYSRLLPDLDSAVQADRVVATTDDKGRFRAKLLLGRNYTAWAAQELEGGRFRSSEVVFPVSARMVIDLVAALEGKLPEYVFDLADAWKDASPLRMRLVRAAPMRETVFVDIEPGRKLRLPLLPDALFELRLETMNGLPIFDTIRTPRDCMVLADQHQGLLRFEVSPAHVLAVRVAAKNDRKPIAGAEVQLTLDWRSNQYYTLGRTNAKGEARVQIPELERYRHVGSRTAVRVRADGFCWINREVTVIELPLDGQQGAEQKPWDLAIDPGTRVTGRLLLGKDQPAAGVRVIAWESILETPMTTVTDANGAFEFKDFWVARRGGLKLGLRLGMILDPKTKSTLGLAPETAGIAFVHMALLDGSAHLDVKEIHLDSLRTLEIEVRNHDGPTTRNPKILVAEPFEKTHVGWPIPYRGDRLGRLRLLVPALPEIMVAASSRDAMSAGTHPISDGEGPFRLILGEPSFFAGRVVGQDESPLPFATLRFTSVQPKANRTQGAGRLLNYFCNKTYMTDAQGRVHIPVPSRNTSYQIWGTYRSMGHLWHIRQRALTLEDHPVTDLTLKTRFAGRFKPTRKK